MEVKICDMCGRRIYPINNGITYTSCKVKKPRVHKWLKGLKMYTWSDVEICNRCAETIVDMSLKKDPLK